MLDRNDKQWYRDALIYQVHVKSFFDANNDGVGDFEGLSQKLDYIKDLGATAVWVMPFFPSPLRDDGYDIADYRGINPTYGSMRDFRRFVREAHERGLRVLIELVINHTSDQHPWFQRARQAKSGSPPQTGQTPRFQAPKAPRCCSTSAVRTRKGRIDQESTSSSMSMPPPQLPFSNHSRASSMSCSLRPRSCSRAAATA